MRVDTIVVLAIVLGIVFFATHESVFAESVPCSSGDLVCLDNPLNTENIPTLIGLALRGLFAIIGTIALIIFIYGGALWMTAFGEEAKVKRGWDTMIWGALGLVVIFGSYVAVDFVLKAILGS